MPLLLAVEDVVARGDIDIEPIEDAVEDTLKDTPEDWLAEALEDPNEMLAPGTRELEELELGTCDVDEYPRAESLKAET